MIAVGLGLLGTSNNKHASTPPIWRYFGGSGLAAAGMQLYYPGISAVFSKAQTTREQVMGV